MRNSGLFAMRRFLLPVAAIVSGLVTGCSTSAAANDASEIKGRLILKGNEPFVQAVVVVSGTEQWELLGLEPAEAQRLQNRDVVVRGLIRGGSSAPLVPALRVVSIERVEP